MKRLLTDFLKLILMSSFFMLIGKNVLLAGSLEKAELFAHDVGVIWGYYNSSLATIDYCERPYNSDVARLFFMSRNKRIFIDVNKLLVKKFGAKLASAMIERVKSDASYNIQLNNLKQKPVADRQYYCAEFIRQHMNGKRDIKDLFSGQMERLFGIKRFLY